MRGVWIGLCLAALAGCGGRSVSQGDGGPADDGAWWPDSRPLDSWWPDARPTDGWWPDRGGAPSSVRDYVVSRLVLADSSTATKLGHDYDGDGTVDNALGAILGGLASMAGGSLDVQDELDTAVNQGSALLLLRLGASSFVSDPAATARTWLAVPEVCCTTPQIPPQCAAQAKASCFDGTHAFQPDPSVPQAAPFGGSIINGWLHAGPGKMRLPLVVGNGLVTLDLTAAHIKGTLSGATITDGILAGGVELTQIQSTLIPAIVQLLNSTLKDPATAPQVKSIITSLFDTNNDGTVTVAEVQSSTIIKTFLGGDKDVDNDGVKELTIGLGFEAVRAVIVP